MRMTLDDTWKNCLSMWRWIAKEAKKDSKAHVGKLKDQWCNKHGHLQIEHDCFFCDYALASGRNMIAWANSVPGRGCSCCPANKIDPKFDCNGEEYCYERKPITFYNKLVSLNRKRLKAKK